MKKPKAKKTATPAKNKGVSPKAAVKPKKMNWGSIKVVKLASVDLIRVAGGVSIL